MFASADAHQLHKYNMCARASAQKLYNESLNVLVCIRYLLITDIIYYSNYDESIANSLLRDCYPTINGQLL